MTDRMPTDQIEAFTRAHLADHPDATTQDVFQAIRDSGYDGLLQTFQVHNAAVKVRPLPCLTTVTEALDFLRAAHARFGDVGIFWDRGWGDSGQATEITVIADGDGQAPLANVDADVYRDLLRDGLIEANSYGGVKARRFHDYLPTVIV